MDVAVSKRFFAFYTEPVGARRVMKEFDDEVAVLALVQEANKPEHEYRSVSGLIVIYGERLEFEPYEKVTAWRVREPAEN